MSSARSSDIVRSYINRTSASPRRGGSPTRSAPVYAKQGSSSSGLANLTNAKKAVWTYLVVAVLVFLLAWWIAYSKFQDVQTWAQLPAYLANPVVFGLITLVVLLLAAFVTAHVSREHLVAMRGLAVSIGLLFLVIGVLLLVTAYLVYRSHNFTGAFYVALLAFVLSIGHFATAWQHRRSISLLVLPLVIYLAVAVYYLWYMADESANCLSGCSATYKVDYV